MEPGDNKQEQIHRQKIPIMLRQKTNMIRNYRTSKIIDTTKYQKHRIKKQKPKNILNRKNQRK